MKKRRKSTARVSERKISRTYRLAAGKIAKARRILGAPTDTATSEMALDLVTFREELAAGTKAMRGVAIEPFGS